MCLKSNTAVFQSHERMLNLCHMETFFNVQKCKLPETQREADVLRSVSTAAAF